MNAQQLKSSILQYAFKGNLVKQNFKEVAVKRFLESINEEKEVLIKAGNLKRVKIHPVDLQSRLWEIPDNWMWSRMGEVLDIRDGTHATPKYVNEGIPLVTSKNLRNNDLDFENIKYISEKDHLEIEKRSKVGSDDILFAMIGTIGNPVLVKKNREFSVKNVGIFKAFPKNKMYMEYVYYYLNYMSPILKKEASGGVQSFVSLTRLRNIPIPIPPLEEQERIVNKIKILEEHIYNYDKLFNRSETARIDFPINLEKSILQHAIQGKLVSQDNTRETTSELLEKIKEEKVELIKRKIIKKEKDLAPISEEEVPFSIPDSWKWVRIKEISTFGNFDTVQPKYLQLDDWILDLEEIEKRTSRLISIVKNKEKNVKSNKYRFEKNDVLYGKLRPYLNKVIVAPDNGYCTTEIFPIRFLGGILPEYAKILLMSPYFLNYATQASYGVKMPRMGTGHMSNGLFPLPPLEEQRQIVLKVSRLLSIIRENTIEKEVLV
ncbi:restriction endonuclease subunit S (plasmid) [Metaplanococcus flavidus]